MSTTLPKTLPAFFWHFIKPQRWKFLILFLTMLGWSVQESVYPYFIKLIIDAVSTYTGDKQEIFTALTPILASFVGIWMVIEITFRTYDFLTARVYPAFALAIREEMFAYTQLHSHTYFADNFAGTIASKITRMPEAMLNIIQLTTTIFAPVIVAFLISSTLLYQVKPIFAYIMLGWFALHLTITFMCTKRCAEYSHQYSDALTTLSGSIVDSFSNITNIRLFARARYENTYLSQFQQVAYDRAHKKMHYDALMKMVLGALSQLFIFFMMGLAIYGWSHNWITVGDFALVMASVSLIGLAWYMGMNLIHFFEHIGTCREALSLISRVHDIADAPDAKPLKLTRGEIIFDHVTFNYARNKNIFKDKSITLQAGKKVGLVGFSGSGKTTFVNLLLRFYDIESGHIRIDEQDISTVTQDSLRSQIAMIPQDTSLFHRSLMENIRYGNPDATDEEVIEASKKAHCHEFIELLPEGYQALVGERGVKLSGGQRQRIAIARAILKNAPILILDEATSALDSVTEQQIQQSLSALMKGRTTVVIAHRLSTLSGMDRILVFKDGQIVEDGTHSALLKNNQHYAHLWAMQAGGFLPEQPVEAAS